MTRRSRNHSSPRPYFPLSARRTTSRPPSTVGVAGLITNNGSRVFGVGGQLFLKENTYEIRAGFVNGDVDYNVYGNGPADGLKLPLQQTGYLLVQRVLAQMGAQFGTPGDKTVHNNYLEKRRFRIIAFVRNWLIHAGVTEN